MSLPIRSSRIDAISMSWWSFSASTTAPTNGRGRDSIAWPSADSSPTSREKNSTSAPSRAASRRCEAFTSTCIATSRSRQTLRAAVGDAEAGQVSAGLPRSRANRAALSDRRRLKAQEWKVFRCAQRCDSRALLLDGHAVVRAARNQPDGHRPVVAAGEGAWQGTEGANRSRRRSRPAGAQELRVEA